MKNSNPQCVIGNAKPHTTALTQETLKNFHLETLEHSSDLLSCGYLLFGPVKETLGMEKLERDIQVKKFVLNDCYFSNSDIKKLPVRWHIMENMLKNKISFDC